MGKTLSKGQLTPWVSWLITVLVVCTAALLYLFFLRSWIDPQPVGRLQVVQELVPRPLSAYSQEMLWLDDAVPAESYTIILTAAHGGGEADIRYGLAVGETTNYLEVTISPLGYAAVSQVTDVDANPLRAHAPFPHVRGGEAINEFWITVERPINRLTAVTIRLNREILWQGTVTHLESQVALVGESYGEATQIDFQQLQLTYEH